MKRIERIIASLGTVCSITVYTDADSRSVDDVRAIRFLDDAEEYIKKLDDLFSIFKDDSEISALNKSAGKGPIRVSEETLSVLEEAIISSELSKGAFDVTAASVRKSKEPGLIVPSDQGGFVEITPDSKGSEEKIVLDRLAVTAEITTEGTTVDLGGIAKGFAADRLREMAENARIEDVLIDLGGTVISIGNERNIGIRDPFRPVNGRTGYEVADRQSGRISKGTADHQSGREASGQDGSERKPVEDSVVMTIRSRDEVICTSGTYEQGEHILDPRTGKSAGTRVLSATVIGQNGAQADALATAAVVLGVDESVKMLKEAGDEAVFILKDGSVFATEGLGQRITILSRNNN